MNETTSSSASRVAPLLGVGLVLAGLYFAREFLLPLALAILVSFLLAPIIRRFEKWGVHRVFAVVLSTALAIVVFASLAYVVAGQVIDLASRLPEYKTNLRGKLEMFKASPQSPLSKATETMRELSEELSKEPITTETATKQRPVPVAVVETAGNSFQTIKSVLAPLAGPVGTATIVFVYVIFMLLERESLRDRVIHLVGRGRLHLTTKAIDEAGRRVSRYLLAQVIVNVSYGLPIGFGLWLIGIPNAVLWGFFAAVLRFVPYLGPLIAAAFPILLSLAVSPDWTAPLCTIGLFVVMEAISNNVVEPWLYGSSTGLSPIAIIISAVFWAWLWGGVGLILATPLTVCIAVLGKHISSLSYLDVLLGDQPPIAPEDRFYQRLLAGDSEEASEIAEEFGLKNGLVDSFDQLFIAALRLAEKDYHDGVLREETRRELFRSLRDLLAEFGPIDDSNPKVLILPASNEADEISALLLARVLATAGVSARVASSKRMLSELVEEAAMLAPRLICVSTVPPASIMPATHLCHRLRERLSSAVITVGLWGDPDEEDRRLQRFKRAQANHVFLHLNQAVAEIRAQPGMIDPVEEKAA